jgi:serine/threonine-protein kinase
MFQAGDTIGSYVLVKRIGDGAFGDVWLAEKTGLVKTRFALKLPKGSDIDAEIFGEEAEVWAQVSGHTNVVPIIEADTHAVRRNGIDISHEQIVIVSEYLPDGSLQTLLNENSGRALTPERAAEITLGILSGLNYLHTRKPAIIHRDLKPDNVLMQGETPRLTDFGISRTLKTASYLQTERIAGTLPYMAPEAFDGHFSPRTDVWAAGVILYQLLSGTLPFPQREMPSLIAAIINDDPPPLPDSVPMQLQYIVQRALEKTRERRYSSADEIRKNLLDALHGREIAAPTLPSPVQPARKTPENEPANFVHSKPFEFSEPAENKTPLFKQVVAVVLALLVLGGGLVFWMAWRSAQASNTTASIVSETPVGNPTDIIPTPSPISSPKEVANGTLVAEGTTRAETQTEPLLFRTSGNLSFWNRETQPQTRPGPAKPISGGFISKWFVKRGQIEPCKSGRDVASYTQYTVSFNGDGGSVDGLVGMPGPFVVDSIDVGAGKDVRDGQRVATLGYIKHILVTAKVSPESTSGIDLGSKAVFSEPESQKAFNGVVSYVNKQTGEAGIKFTDEEIFDEKRCLSLKPNVKGKVTFAASDRQK